MSKRNSKAFTLIELIGVLVIMAIIALIVTPLVMNIIRKARVSADRRSVDAYGRSIELAIAGYLLDTGTFPTSVEQLTIEYSGSQVVCSTTQINSDSSVYLAGCTVSGRSVDNYTYGEDKTPQAPTYTAYQVGDEVTYNNINYYVINDSDTTEESVTLLKAEPLSASDITTYSAGAGAQTDNNGGIQYGTTSTYSTSYVKATVDAWKNANAVAATEARLITFEELTEDLGYELQQVSPSSQAYVYTDDTPNWIYNVNYNYWTKSQYNDYDSYIWQVGHDSGGNTLFYTELSRIACVRPVIVLPKSALTTP